MIIRSIISTLIFLLICIPMIIVSAPVVAILLLTKWDGYSTIFGNSKWGRANNHFAYPTKTYWEEFNWLVIRNPVNNLMSHSLALKMKPYTLEGDENIGDKIAGGFYKITMGKGWEYYYIKPYGTRCIRIRIGWKIKGNDTELAPFVFAINFWKSYSGV